MRTVPCDATMSIGSLISGFWGRPGIIFISFHINIGHLSWCFGFLWLLWRGVAPGVETIRQVLLSLSGNDLATTCYIHCVTNMSLLQELAEFELISMEVGELSSQLPWCWKRLRKVNRSTALGQLQSFSWAAAKWPWGAWLQCQMSEIWNRWNT